MTLLINILLGLYVFVALLMVLVILMQRPKSEGLGAAFGGGVTENIFGAQTTNVLTKITGWLATLFFLLTFVLSILYAHKGNAQSGLRRDLMKDLPPAVSPTPTPAPAVATGASPTASPAHSASPSPSSTVSVVPPTTSTATPAASPVSSASPSDSPVSSPAPTAAPRRRQRR